ncbi:MAG: hypothetical protein RIG63_07760 [Coleofasciculus chthonoplastes F3-SA18-01]|jgi:hypothetical protein|uniref:hypothetical protein n=1 Tax=Coleofasciculus chthonoplastes TaxID=64178 RepID=UPI0032FE741D
MSYSQFTLAKAVADFNLVLVEVPQFLPEVAPVTPSPTLTEFLETSLPLTATGSEKARSEGIIYPILWEVKRLLFSQVSLFSGEEFDVDSTVGLNGICDFILSRSVEQLFIQAPVVILTEAKKADIRTGLGQCVAEMVAAQRFNAAAERSITTVYGCVTSGTQWRFLKLEGQTVTIALTDYPLPPVDQILGFLIWMVREG